MTAIPCCDETYSDCRCTLALGHEGPHICETSPERDGARCGGSWLPDGDEMVIYAWPGDGFGLPVPSLPARFPR